MILIDLHTHTTASDGTDAPAELVRKAAATGLAALAVTDHDTVAGLAEAEEAGRDLGVPVVRGCELSTRTADGEMHILGLWLPRDVRELEGLLLQLRARRLDRNEGILEKLRGLGFDIAMDDVLEHARGETVGRPHIARAMVTRGYVPSVSVAFKEYLGAQGRAFLPKVVLEPEKAVRMLAGIGATVCLAHPLLSSKRPDRTWLEEFVRALMPLGLSALEAWHSEQSAEQTGWCLSLARRLGLGVSGGSDYHGSNKPRLALGTGYGNLRVDVGVLEDLLERRRRQGLPC
ncbi:MAG: PHP domain-containing protein [Desulfovibrio sp.]|jgi:predicted metal-dependent phosphoesterase TrpH|nr:PHP domain-containing protein [Desulfovibrio sp.]